MRTHVSVAGGPLRVRREFLKPLSWAVGVSAIIAAAALASPPSRNSVGATFSVLSQDVSSTVEIRLSPKAPFDTVNVEAGSGVSSLSPPCSFNGVVAGGTYVCHVTVTQKASEASLTLNIVARRTVDPKKPMLVEINHFTLANQTFVRPKANVSPTRKPLLESAPGPTAIK